MPRVLSFKVGPLWVAFRLNDHDEVGPRRFGFNRGSTEMRAAMA